MINNEKLPDELSSQQRESNGEKGKGSKKIKAAAPAAKAASKKLSLKKKAPDAQPDEPVIEPVIKKITAKSAAAAPKKLDKPAPKKAADSKQAVIKPNIKKIAVKRSAAKKGATAKPKSEAVIAVIETEKSGNIGETTGPRRISFMVRFHTTFGESISVTGNHPLLGNNDLELAFPLQYFNDDYWRGVLEIPEVEIIDKEIVYNYVLTSANGSKTPEWGDDKVIKPQSANVEELLLVDSWNHAGYIENSFYTEPFKRVLLRDRFTPVETNTPANTTHIFRVKAPLLSAGEVVCLVGSAAELGAWDTNAPLLLSRKQEEDFFSVAVDLSAGTFPLSYKYGVFNVNENKFVQFETGNNRILYDSAGAKKMTVVSDGFVVLPNDGFKAAGVAIPVFSLRSRDGLGVGEFNDIRLLVDWAKIVGLKLIQILPVNDTTATHTSADSYPYAAISAFALHPIYLNIASIGADIDKKFAKSLSEKQALLQSYTEVDYEAVMELKWSLIRRIFPAKKAATFQHESFQRFFAENNHWLVPYAAFCYLRDKNNTADFSKWTDNSVYNTAAVEELAANPQTAADEISVHFFVQYHLHLQLQAATRYAHENGIIVKGDIPIGIYRNSCDAWQQPQLYNMNMQAGAPPDDFAVKGQNWGFPTYNWQQMQQDGFRWWKLRFEQMSYYFDAFRIDHILGFFRIWSIPMDAVQGIMGHFVPALPVHITEFNERNIYFDKQRFTQPYITDDVLLQLFKDDAESIKQGFLEWRGNGQYQLKAEFNTQRKIEAYFAEQTSNEYNDYVKNGLYDLVSNVLIFEVENSHGQQFHFRIAISDTTSYQYLDDYTKQQLSDLYVNYFFRRQNDFWEREAMHKLPDLKRSTNMLICGEDLGMVPDCVPGVMKRLGILSLEIQRMPKDPARLFFHPNDAPYLSVVTPSTHDMSTIRGWWEEDRTNTQKFFNTELGQQGEAPYYCEPWINRAVVVQHLYSPAMWSIFQLQDLLGINEKIRRENPNDERINIPADPKHYWRYRMHIPLEDLIQETAFNTDLQSLLQAAGRV